MQNMRNAYIEGTAKGSRVKRRPWQSQEIMGRKCSERENTG